MTRENLCNERHGGLFCGRPKEHSDVHIAYTADGSTICNWPQRPKAEGVPTQPKLDNPYKTLQDRLTYETTKRELSKKNMAGDEGLRALARKAVSEGKTDKTSSEVSTKLSKEELVNLLTEVRIKEAATEATDKNKGPDMDNTKKGEPGAPGEAKKPNSEPPRPKNAKKAPPPPPSTDVKGEPGADKAPGDEPLEKIIANRIEVYLKNRGVDKDSINAITDQDEVNVGLTHSMFGKILQLAVDGHHIWLTGPSGSGKTYLCGQVARALQRPFESLSVGMQTSKTDLFGYMDAHGNFIQTSFYRAWINGGLFCLDEVDNGNANVIAMTNAATSSNICSFPCGMVERHPDFVMIACANTYGLGADAIYVGRNQIDGATRNRFAFVELPYDETLEQALCPNKMWLKTVRRVRESVNVLKEKVIVSPRASFGGYRVLERGYSIQEAMDMFIFQGVNTDVKERILNHAKIEEE